MQSKSVFFYNCLHLLLEQKPTSFLQCNKAQLFTHQLIKESHIS